MGDIVKRSVPTVVVEPRTLLREGVTALLHGTPYRIVYSGSSVSELPGPGLVPEHPQLVILGLSGGSQETMDAVRTLRDQSPDCKIVAIGDRGDLYDLNEILNCGIDGILLNVASAEALFKVLDLVLLGQQVIILDRRQLVEPSHHNGTLNNDSAPRTIPNSSHRSAELTLGAQGATWMNGQEPTNIEAHVQLSSRERQVLICVARGEANKIIARSCSITEATVKAHLKAILRKISVRNRTQAALWAIDKGLASEAHAFQRDAGREGQERKTADLLLAPSDDATLGGRG